MSTNLCSSGLKVTISGINVIFQVFWSFCISFYRKSNNSFWNNFFSKLKALVSKYLLRNFNDNNSIERIKKHCIDTHKVDKKNNFFINLLKTSISVFCERKYLRCD